MLTPLTYIHVGNVDIEYAFQSLCPLVRMSRCRGAQGCAGAAIGQDVPVPRSTGMCGSGQVIDARRSAGVGSGCCCAAIPFLPLPRWAGVTNARYLLFGANIPWYRVRLTLGLGTRATSLAMAAPTEYRKLIKS